MATEILSQSTSRGWSVVVTVDDAMTRRRLFSAVTEAAAKPRSVLRLWRNIILKRMRERFIAQEGPGGKKWAPLSLHSTVPIREFRGITRFGPPPRLGGSPALTLRSAMQEYFNAWTSTGFGGPHRPIDVLRTAAGLSEVIIGVDHIAVVNEYRRTTKGAIPDKKVPARSIAYIRGDKKLLDKLVRVFAAYIEKALVKAGG